MLDLKRIFLKDFNMNDEFKIDFSEMRYYRMRKALFTFVYVLTDEFNCTLPKRSAPKFTGQDAFVVYENGKLTIKAGFAWDGPSGPSIDTKAFIRASLVHDALYRLMSKGVIQANETNRYFSDLVMKALNLAGGMTRFRAWYTFLAVHFFGKKHSKRRRKVYRLDGGTANFKG